MEDLLNLAASAMQNSTDETLLCAFADCVRDHDQKWGEPLLEYLRGDHDQLIDMIGEDQFYFATVREAIGDDHLGWLAIDGEIPPPSFDINKRSLRPTFLKDYETGEWVKLVPKKATSRRGRRFIRQSKAKSIAAEAARVVYEHGGIGSLVHAVLGAFYFDPNCSKPLRPLRGLEETWDPIENGWVGSDGRP